MKGIVNLLNPITWPEPPTSLAQSARIGRQAALIIAKSCGSETLKTRWHAAGAVSALVALLACGYVRVSINYTLYYHLYSLLLDTRSSIRSINQSF
jgi:hypothetical protein